MEMDKQQPNTEHWNLTKPNKHGNIQCNNTNSSTKMEMKVE